MQLQPRAEIVSALAGRCVCVCVCQFFSLILLDAETGKCYAMAGAPGTAPLLYTCARAPATCGLGAAATPARRLKRVPTQASGLSVSSPVCAKSMASMLVTQLVVLTTALFSVVIWGILDVMGCR